MPEVLTEMPDKRTSRVLTVDDNEAGRYAVTRILKKAGFDVIEAANGTDALTLAVDQHPDLVLLDVNLPDISGFEVCRRLKQDTKTASIPVVHLSATFVHTRERVHGLEGGADGYLVHPIEPEELVAVIRSFLRIRNAETALRESEEKFRGIFNKVNDAIHLHNIGEDGNPGKFIDVNDIACKMLQYSREEMLQYTPLDFTTEYHSRPIDKILEELAANGGAVFETGHTRKDGTVVPVEINAHMITLTGKKAVLSVVRDITERKKTDQKIRTSLVQIESDLEQMALFNDQIRNPLAVIIALLDREPESKTNTRIHEQALMINALITTLDRQYVNSEKVREFLRKHYDFIQRPGL